MGDSISNFPHVIARWQSLFCRPIECWVPHWPLDRVKGRLAGETGSASIGGKRVEGARLLEEPGRGGGCWAGKRRVLWRPERGNTRRNHGRCRGWLHQAASLES